MRVGVKVGVLVAIAVATKVSEPDVKVCEAGEKLYPFNDGVTTIPEIPQPPKTNMPELSVVAVRVVEPETPVTVTPASPVPLLLPIRTDPLTAGQTVLVGVKVRVFVAVTVEFPWVLVLVTVAVLPPTVNSAERAGYHLSEIFWLPKSFGWTPSPVSVAVLNPVH